MSIKELYLEAMALNDGGEHDAFLAKQAPDCVWVVPGVGELRGREAVREWLTPFWTAFSSFRHDHTRVVADGDTVIAEGIWTGTHDGPMATPMGELPATGRTISFPFAVSVSGDLEGGLAQSVRVYFDSLALLAQLGAMPEPAAV
jgi:predicted ester cyclase